MTDLRKMQLGDVVDFCISYNKRQEEAERQAEQNDKPQVRLADQRDIDSYFG